ncbi:MAG: DUF5799 family protein [Halodesulfurarchaeum sp.]
MTETWRDRIVSARMSVDSQFEDRIEASSFSRQQWGLVMTAVEFEIENPQDPEAAEIVANTDNLVHVLPELESIDNQMAQMGSGGGGSSGLLDGVKDALGFGSGSSVDESTKQEAISLTEEYATQLQSELESTGQWGTVREIAASEE